MKKENKNKWEYVKIEGNKRIIKDRLGNVLKIDKIDNYDLDLEIPEVE